MTLSACAWPGTRLWWRWRTPGKNFLETLMAPGIHVLFFNVLALATNLLWFKLYTTNRGMSYPHIWIRGGNCENSEIWIVVYLRWNGFARRERHGAPANGVYRTFRNYGGTR